MPHEYVDWALTVGIIAATVFAAYVSHRLSKRDQAEKDVEKHKQRLNRHAVEIRHTQKEAGIEPFYPDSENDL